MRQHQFGKRGRPRYKGKGQLLSVEGKTNKQGIRWREERVLWGPLALPARLPADDPVVAHALAARIKYVRLVRRVLNGRAQRRLRRKADRQRRANNQSRPRPVRTGACLSLSLAAALPLLNPGLTISPYHQAVARV